MSSGALIGGEPLAALVQLIGPRDAPSENIIGIQVDHEHLCVSGTPVHPNDRIVQDATKTVTDDLHDKKRSVESFVSIRLHIGGELLRLTEKPNTFDLRTTDTKFPLLFTPCDASDGFSIEAGEFVLIRTLERIYLPPTITAFIQSRTTVAMCGLDVTPTHQIVPGFRQGTLFLHLHNRSNKTINITKHCALAELFFFELNKHFRAMLHCTLKRKVS